MFVMYNWFNFPKPARVCLKLDEGLRPNICTICQTNCIILHKYSYLYMNERTLRVGERLAI